MLLVPVTKPSQQLYSPAGEMLSSVMLRPRSQNFGLGLDKMASAWPRSCSLLTWPRINVLSNAKYHWLYPFRGCIMARFPLQFCYLLRHSNVGIKKFSYVLLALLPCVLVQKYLHVALAAAFWPRVTSLVTATLLLIQQRSRDFFLVTDVRRSRTSYRQAASCAGGRHNMPPPL